MSFTREEWLAGDSPRTEGEKVRVEALRPVFHDVQRARGDEFMLSPDQARILSDRGIVKICGEPFAGLDLSTPDLLTGEQPASKPAAAESLQWPLKISPEKYLERYPNAKCSNLAKAIIDSRR